MDLPFPSLPSISNNTLTHPYTLCPLPPLYDRVYVINYHRVYAIRSNFEKSYTIDTVVPGPSVAYIDIVVVSHQFHFRNNQSRVWTLCV